ncbi:hypothetical protein TVAG_306900, partial [Trichomonas vaginalis G3]
MKQVKFVPHQSQWTDEEFQAMVEGVENDIDGELEGAQTIIATKIAQSSLMTEMTNLKADVLMNQASNEKCLNDFTETLRNYERENRDLARLIYRFFEEIDAIWKVLGKDRTCNTVLREYQIEEGIVEEEEEEEEEEKHEAVPEAATWATLVADDGYEISQPLPIPNPQQGDRE